MLKEKRERGRPKKYEERMIRKDFYMPESMLNNLKQKSKEKNVSMNELARKIFDYYILNDYIILEKSSGSNEKISWTGDDSKILLELLNYYVLLDYIPIENFEKIKGYFDLYKEDIIESTKKSILKKILESLKLHYIGEKSYFDKLNTEHPEAEELFKKINKFIQF